MKEKSVDNILACVIYFAFGKREYKHDIGGWVDFFAEQRAKHPELLGIIGIRDRTICKESTELTQAYVNLMSTDMISFTTRGFHENIHYGTVQLEEYVKAIERRFSRGEQMELECIAEKFRERFSLQARVE